MLHNEDANQIEAFRQAGLIKDQSQISSMIASLANPVHIGYTYTIIHALAQMGAVKALPIIDMYAQDVGHDAQDETSGDLHNFSIAARARLVAENMVEATPNGKTAAATKVKSFYQELKLTPADLNNSLVAYYQPQNITGNQDSQHWVSMPVDTFYAHPVGVYAVRELADMMYQGSYASCQDIPEVNQIHFAMDYPSALKMRLVPTIAVRAVGYHAPGTFTKEGLDPLG